MNIFSSQLLQNAKAARGCKMGQNVLFGTSESSNSLVTTRYKHGSGTPLTSGRRALASVQDSTGMILRGAGCCSAS
ncbi:hypothetical protein BDR03DRAFT_950181, partial [Suillus americanus]